MEKKNKQNVIFDKRRQSPHSFQFIFMSLCKSIDKGSLSLFPNSLGDSYTVHDRHWGVCACAYVCVCTRKSTHYPFYCPFFQNIYSILMVFFQRKSWFRFSSFEIIRVTISRNRDCKQTFGSPFRGERTGMHLSEKPKIPCK